MKTKLMAFLALTTLFAVTCSSKSPTTSSNATAPSKVSVTAGVNDSQDPTIAVLAYMPNTVTVKTGATVEWTATGPEPHTISFLPSGQSRPVPGTKAAVALQSPKQPSGPFDGTTTISSGLGPAGPNAGPLKFSVTFSKPGTYTYFCAIHTNMNGSVTVTDDASKAQSQDAITQAGNTERDGYLSEGRSAKQQLTSAPVKKKAGPGGSTIWTVKMGTNTAHTAVVAFQPPSVPIKPGDRVVFLNNSGEPHTATFAGGTHPPQNPEDPKLMAASGKSPLRLKATGFFNTGWLPPNAPPGNGPPEAARSFTFIVPKAGTYPFYCALHVQEGMAGTIKAS